MTVCRIDLETHLACAKGTIFLQVKAHEIIWLQG